MNAVLFKILFGQSRSAYYQSLETHLSTIEELLQKATNANQENPLRGETILMETFHHASIAAYQAEDEINNTFNIYLIFAGIIATGLPVIGGLILQTKEQGYLYLPTAFSATAAIILALVPVLSLCFLERLLQLSKERYNNINIMSNIQDYYGRKLETQMPGIDEVLRKQRGVEEGVRVPLVMLLTIIVLGSSCIGGFFAIVLPTLFLELLLSIVSPISFFIGYLIYYNKRKSKLTKPSNLLNL